MDTNQHEPADSAPDSAAAHDWRPDRFMVIVAHPDDAEGGAAGTAGRWIDEGAVGWLVCCTSGEEGGHDLTISPSELAARRESEQQAAARITGYKGVSFLHVPNGRLINDLLLREKLVREIRTFRPDAVITSDPETIFAPPRVLLDDAGVNHHEHRAVGMAAVDAVYPSARVPMSFPGLGLPAHKVRRLYLFWSNHPDVRVDISSTLSRVVEANRQYASQFSDLDAMADAVRGWAATEGKEIGVSAAEAFRMVPIQGG